MANKKKKDYDIAEALRKVEEEIIESMIRNLKHHRAEEMAEGFDWSQWQVEQLAALEEFKKRNAAKYPGVFQDINEIIDGLIRDQRMAGRSQQEEKILNAIKRGFSAQKQPYSIAGQFFNVNDRKMNSLIEATVNDIQKAEYATLRLANDHYRKVIFNAQFAANTGALTYEQAIDMATKDMLRSGLNCVVYKNGARHTAADYADMAIKTAEKRAYLAGEGEMRQEWGISTVIMNKRTDACPLCMPFAGKVLIDDVWSGGKSDGKHMLMSSAIAQGLYHPRCRDVHTTWFEGINSEPKPYTEEEQEQIQKDYELEQKAKYAERQKEQQERMAKFSLDPTNQRTHQSRAEKWERIEEQFKAAGEELRKKDQLVVASTDEKLKMSAMASKEDLLGYTQDEVVYVKDIRRGSGYNIIEEYLEDATPGRGLIDFEDGYNKDKNQKEIETADLLFKTFGGNLVLKVEKDGQKNPDYEWMGRLWDLKSTTTEKAANSAIKSGLKQIKENPGGIILNFEDIDFSMDELIKVIDQRMWWYPNDIVDIMIISKGKVVKILRY